MQSCGPPGIEFETNDVMHLICALMAVMLNKVY